MIHSSTPAKSTVQVIEYFDGICSIILFEIRSNFFSQPSGSRHQATAVTVALLARTRSCNPFQLEGDTFTVAVGWGIGIQELVVETTPLLLTNSDLG